MTTGPARRSTCSSPRELVTVGLLIAALLGALYLVGTERVGLRTDDAGHYVRMAEEPAYLARLWYSFRVLSPLLASAAPGGAVTGFTVVTLASLALACVALYAYERAVGLSRTAALAGAGLFAVSGGPVRLLTTPSYVDAASYLGEAIAFLALASGHFGLFLTAVATGVLNRESALLLVPLHFVASPPGWRARRRDALVLSAPLAVYALLIAVKLGLGGVLGGGVPLASIAPLPRAYEQGIPTLQALFDLYSTFGVLWLLALKNLPGPTRLQRGALIFGGLVVLQLVVARGDEGRVLSHLFVLVVPLAMLEVDHLRSSGVRYAAPLVAIFVLACAASMVHGRWTVFDWTALRYGLVASGTAVALTLTGVGWWHQRTLTVPRRTSSPPASGPDVTAAIRRARES
jgi:hypothetical protein